MRFESTLGLSEMEFLSDQGESFGGKLISSQFTYTYLWSFSLYADIMWSIYSIVYSSITWHGVVRPGDEI